MNANNPTGENGNKGNMTQEEKLQKYDQIKVVLSEDLSNYVEQNFSIWTEVNFGGLGLETTEETIFFEPVKGKKIFEGKSKGITSGEDMAR